MPINEKSTLEGVAQEARIFLATVDRVVTGRPGVHVRTMAKVEAAVAKLGYRPDPAAAHLARNQTLRFCFILPNGSNGFVYLLALQVDLAAD